MTGPAGEALAVRTVDLSVHYGRHQAVQSVSVSIAPGESVALVGPNGAGKSSLLKALAGLVPATGSVAVGRPGARHVAYVPQRSAARWDLPLTVEEVVRAGCRRTGGPWRRPTAADRATARQALDLLDIAGLAERVVGALSGGQAQRVLLARAFAQRPRLLLLDEPFAGLDRTSAEHLADAIAAVRTDGLTVVCALHELAMARRLFPRTIALSTTVLADGPTPDVLDAAGIERIFAGTGIVAGPGAAA